MIIFLLFSAFLTAFTLAGGLIGYLAEPYYPGSGSMIAVTIFMVVLWPAWSVAVRVAERYWPEPPPAT